MATVTAFKARRPLVVGERRAHVGELVPEAVTWRNRDALVRTSKLGEVNIDGAELVAAIEQFCPQRREELLHAYGFDPEPASPGGNA